MVMYWLPDGKVLASGWVNFGPEMLQSKLGTVLAGCIDKTVAGQKFLIFGFEIVLKMVLSSSGENVTKQVQQEARCHTIFAWIKC